MTSRKRLKNVKVANFVESGSLKPEEKRFKHLKSNLSISLSEETVHDIVKR